MRALCFVVVVALLAGCAMPPTPVADTVPVAVDATPTAPAVPASPLGISAPTRRPSLTPIPTRTQLPADEQAYISALVVIIRAGQAALDENAALVHAPRPNDNAWLAAVVKNAAAFKRVEEQVRAVTPPPRLQELHNALIVGYESLAFAADYFARGVDTMDAALIEQGSQYMAEGTEKIQEAGTLMDVLIGK